MAVSFWFSVFLFVFSTAFKTFILIKFTFTFEHCRTQIALFFFITKNTQFSRTWTKFTPSQSVKFAACSESGVTEGFKNREGLGSTESCNQRDSFILKICFVNLFFKDRNKIVSFFEKSWQNVRLWTVPFDPLSLLPSHLLFKVHKRS